MVAKTINDRVPERTVPSNQCCLYRNNQVTFNAAENHESTSEIVALQIGGLLDAPGMLSQPPIYNRRLAFLQSCTPPPRRHCFANINWSALRLSIQSGDCGIQLKSAQVVKRIDAGPGKTAGGRQPVGRRLIEERDCLVNHASKLGGVKNMQAIVKAHTALQPRVYLNGSLSREKRSTGLFSESMSTSAASLGNGMVDGAASYSMRRAAAAGAKLAARRSS